MQEGVVSIVLPVYNASVPVETAIHAIQTFCTQARIAHEIIVVDDGSDPAYKKYVQSCQGMDGVRLVTHEHNSGKGAAVYTGFSWAQGSVIGFIDADLPYDLSVIHDALEVLEPGDADVVIGSRRHPRSKQIISYGVLRNIINRVFGRVVGVVVGIPWKDTQCGVKFFSRDAAATLFAHIITPGFAFDVEILARAHHHTMSIVEVPVHLVRQQPSTVSVVTHGWDMWKALWRIRKMFIKK